MSTCIPRKVAFRGCGEAHAQDQSIELDGHSQLRAELDHHPIMLLELAPNHPVERIAVAPGKQHAERHNTHEHSVFHAVPSPIPMRI